MVRLVEVKPKNFTYTYKIFCDLDGVMSDLESKADEIIDGKYTQERYDNDRKYQKLVWDAIRKYDGDFWAEMDMLPNARALWNRISKHDVEILTATGSSIATAGAQKREWVARMLSPSVKVNLTQTAREKAQYAAPNHVLIDDKEKAIGPWVAAGGIGILHDDKQIDRTFTALSKLGL